MKQYSIHAFLIAASVLTLAACRNDRTEEPVAPLDHVDLRLGIAFLHGAHPYELGSIYEDAGGHMFRLDTMRFVISAPYGVDDPGDVVASFPSACLLIDAAIENDHLLGELHAHHLHELRFNVGLDAALDHADPSHPALANVAPMHSGDPAMGHYFLILAGQVDGNADGILDGTDPYFSYKCIGDGLLQQAMAPAHADIPENGPLTSWAMVDMEILFEGIDLLANPSATGNGSINMQLMEQLAEAMEQGH